MKLSKVQAPNQIRKSPRITRKVQKELQEKKQ